jgi:hypothetical protein
MPYAPVLRVDHQRLAGVFYVIGHLETTSSSSPMSSNPRCRSPGCGTVMIQLGRVPRCLLVITLVAKALRESRWRHQSNPVRNREAVGAAGRRLAAMLIRGVKDELPELQNSMETEGLLRK